MSKSWNRPTCTIWRKKILEVCPKLTLQFPQTWQAESPEHRLGDPETNCTASHHEKKAASSAGLIFSLHNFAFLMHGPPPQKAKNQNCRKNWSVDWVKLRGWLVSSSCFLAFSLSFSGLLWIPWRAFRCWLVLLFLLPLSGWDYLRSPG